MGTQDEHRKLQHESPHILPLRIVCGGTKRACITKGATVREYYYRIDNQRDVYDPRKKNQKFCSKRPNHPKCPKSCNNGSVCYEKLCSSYGPCDDAGGKVFHVDKKTGRPYNGDNIKGLRGTFYTTKRPYVCRCFIPRVGNGPVFEKP